MKSSYPYEYRENIHLDVELTPASVSRVWLRARICPSAGWLTHYFLRPQGAITPGFYPLRRGWVYCLAPEDPLIRGMPTGPKVFLVLPDACGLRPCDRTHLLPWWDGKQIPELTSTWHFGSQADVQQSFTVFILPFNILVSRNLVFVSFFPTFYWSTKVFSVPQSYILIWKKIFSKKNS